VYLAVVTLPVVWTTGVRFHPGVQGLFYSNGPIQSPVSGYCVLFAWGQGVWDMKLTAPHLVPRFKNACNYTSSPPCLHGVVLNSVGYRLSALKIEHINKVLRMLFRLKYHVFIMSLIKGNFLHWPFSVFCHSSSPIKHL
jgi:hypothetical protein